MTPRCLLGRPAAAVVLVVVATAAPASADWTIGAFLGGSHTRPASLTLNQPAESTNVSAAAVRYRSESLEMPVYYGYRAAFYPRSSWFGVEGELIHMKVVADTARTTRISGRLDGVPVSQNVALSSIIEEFSITHGVNLLLVNAVARRRVIVAHDGEPRLALMARLGAGGSIPHAESTIRGRRVEGYQWNAFSVQAAAGLEVRLVRRIALVGEYKLTHSTHDVEVADGRGRTSLTTHHAAVGVAFRIGSGSQATP